MPITRNPKRAEYKGYVSIELNEPDIEQILDASKKPADLWKQVAQIVDDGYKFSIGYDEVDEVVKATLMDTEMSRTSAGWMLSGQAENTNTALAVLVYKHVAKTNGDWTPFLSSKSRVNGIR